MEMAVWFERLSPNLDPNLLAGEIGETTGHSHREAQHGCCGEKGDECQRQAEDSELRCEGSKCQTKEPHHAEQQAQERP